MQCTWQAVRFVSSACNVQTIGHEPGSVGPTDRECCIVEALREVFAIASTLHIFITHYKPRPCDYDDLPRYLHKTCVTHTPICIWICGKTRATSHSLPSVQVEARLIVAECIAGEECASANYLLYAPRAYAYRTP